MGTGWRRAFCTSVRCDPPDSSSTTTPSPSPRSRLSLFGFHPTSSNPSTPRHQHPPPPTTDSSTPTPSLRCRTTITTTTNEEAPPPKPSSPRSPSRFTLFKNTLRLSRFALLQSSSCGICLRSLRAATGTAIFIAECSHAFHFPCISSHVKKHRALSCPVCSATWRQSPRLSLEANDDDANTGGWRAAIERVRAVKREQEEDEKQKNCPPPNSSYHSPPAKAYNDDEPLLSPGGSRFNPIPEADEDDHPPGAGDRNPSLDVAFSPDVAFLSSSRAHESHVVSVKVKAAAAAAAGGRAPVDLVAVIDAGGEIPAAKFHVLKGALRAVVASLGSGDRLSIVAFSYAAKRLLPLRRMTLQGRRAAARVADRVARAVDGSNASAEALRKANRILDDRRERNPVSGIVILSDAQNRHHHPAKLSRYVSSVSCWASSTAGSGGTRYAHVEVPVPGDELRETTLANCVVGLLSVVAQDVRVEVSSPSGEIIAFYSPRGQPPASGSPRSISLGDLYADEERELLMEVRIPAVAGDCTLTARCTYRDPTTREDEVACGARTTVHPRHTGRHVSPEAEAVRNAYVATRAVAESRRLAEVNEMTAAARLLESARALLRRSGAAGQGARAVEAELAEVQRRRRRREAAAADEAVEALTPMSAWRAAERLAKVAMKRKSLNRRVSDLHGFEDARF